jgi:hypothetical protein
MKYVIGLLLFATMTVISTTTRASITFTVHNRQSESLGTVTVNCSGTYYVTVAGSTNASVEIPDSAISITICGTTVPVGQRTLIHLASGKPVEVLWDGGPIVIDPDEILMRAVDSETEHLMAELRARAGDWAIKHTEFYDLAEI